MRVSLSTTRAILFLAICLVSANATLAQSTCPEIAGTWEYVLEDQEGLFMATDTHGMWVIVDKDRPALEGEPPTDEALAEAYRTMQGTAMTHTCEGQKVTVEVLFSANPNLVGTSFSWEYEMDGDEFAFWGLSADGSRVGGGRCRRISD